MQTLVKNSFRRPRRSEAERQLPEGQMVKYDYIKGRQAEGLGTKNRFRYFRKRSGKTRQLPFLSPRQVIESGHVGTGPAAAGLAPDGTPPGPRIIRYLKASEKFVESMGSFLGSSFSDFLTL